MRSYLELSKIILPAIVGLLSGVFGSFVAPWVNWGIEKKKMTRKNQEELIKEVRSVLSHEGIESSTFRNHAVYSRIKPHISKCAQKAVEGDFSDDGGEIIIISTASGRSAGINPFRNEILDEIYKLEKKWSLI